MIICFACSAETREQLDALRGREGHSSYDDVIRHAVELYFGLSSRIGESGSIIIPESGTLESVSSATTMPGPEVRTEGVPSVFARPERSGPTATTAVVDGSGFAVVDWIFGQYNKLLPMKAGLRAVASLVVDSGEPLAADADLLAATTAAAGLAQRLLAQDRQCELPRDEYLATGFPLKSEASSLRRFRTQFMFDVSGSEKLHGLPAEYGFLGFADAARDRVSLTEPGWLFASLENPVLDSSDASTCERFSIQEGEYLLDHIKNKVPKECAAFRAICEGIEAGADSPTDLDHFLLDSLSDETKESVANSFVSTQRSGAISRFGDLGLVARKRRGVRVTYVLTDVGQTFRQDID